MATAVAIVGFGEAAHAFVGDPNWSAPVRAYDRLTDTAATCAAKLADYEALRVQPALSLGEALATVDTILSLVTADQALNVATAAINVGLGSLYLDMNSVAPVTKRAAAAELESRGARYVDVAIMAPVNPVRLSVPLLLSGAASEEAQGRLSELGFENVRIVGEHVGDASAVKMIRSVVVKGIEALTAEAMLAAVAAGVTDEVLASLDASERQIPWRERVDYNLQRMIVHGARRAEEMEEAAWTLEHLGVAPMLTLQVAQRQREIGGLRLDPAPGLDAKLRQLSPRKDRAA